MRFGGVFGFEVPFGLLELLFQVPLVFGGGLGILTCFGPSSGGALDILDTTNVLQDIFKSFSFIFQTRGAVFALEEFQELLQVFATGFLFGDGA